MQMFAAAANGSTVLHAAVRVGNEEATKYVFKPGLASEKFNNLSVTPLQLAAASGN